MYVVRRRVLTAVVALGFLWGAPRAWAVFPDIETFENDTDSYTPPTDPVNDPNLSGSPPAGWHDMRAGGGAGVIEEVPSGFLGINTSPGGGANYGMVYAANPAAPPVYTDGPHGHPAASNTPLPQSWSYQAD